MRELNGILAATVVSTIAALVASVGTTKYLISEYDDRITDANVVAINARAEVSRVAKELDAVRADLSTYAGQMVGVFASGGAEKKRMDGIREELDAMQTQIRILQLRP